MPRRHLALERIDERRRRVYLLRLERAYIILFAAQYLLRHNLVMDLACIPPEIHHADADRQTFTISVFNSFDAYAAKLFTTANPRTGSTDAAGLLYLG